MELGEKQGYDPLVNVLLWVNALEELMSLTHSLEAMPE